MEAQGRPQVRGSQDDSFVGYVFQRAQTDPDFPHYAANKQPARWALGDDTFIDVSLNLQKKYNSLHAVSFVFLVVLAQL
jgi:hypothetical protein